MRSEGSLFMTFEFVILHQTIKILIINYVLES